MHKQRIKKTANLLSEHNIDTLIIEDPVNIRYLTGLDVSAGTLLIGLKKALIFLDGRYFEALKNKSPIEVKLLSDENLIDVLGKGSFGKKIGFDQEKTSFFRFEKLTKALKKCKKKISLHPVENIVKNQVRIIKSPHEIGLMKKAAALAAEGFLHAVNQLETGVSEEQIARILKTFWLEEGAGGFSFEPIVAFGKNSACPHHRPTEQKLKKGDIVLFDLGATLHDYASDMTRVLFFGKPNPRLVSVYETVHEAHERALKKCKPGTKISTLDTAARSLIDKKGWSDNFRHSLGHGIGLEVHEAPSMHKNGSSLTLLPGMAITIEPGVYLPGIGGVRIEDTIIITEDSYISITPLTKDLTILG